MAKKDGCVHIVHNLGPLNKVTVKDAAQPPLIDQYAKQCSVQAIYTTLDLSVGYDHRTTHPDSHDVTTFDTPLGAHHTVLPQGWTGSLSIFHNNIAFILQDEMEIAPNWMTSKPLSFRAQQFSLSTISSHTLSSLRSIHQSFLLVAFYHRTMKKDAIDHLALALSLSTMFN